MLKLIVSSAVLASATVVENAFVPDDTATPRRVEISYAPEDTRIPNQFLVVLKDDVDIDDYLLDFDGNTDMTIRIGNFHAFRVDNIDDLIFDESVKYIEEDRLMFTTCTTQQNAPYGVERVGVRTMEQTIGIPLVRGRENVYQKEFTHPSTAGSGVKVYVIDSGINAEHEDFQVGDVSRVQHFYAVPGLDIATDENGHGTHVAGTIGGKTYGVAKSATLLNVKVFGPDGSQSSSAIIKAFDMAVEDCCGKSSSQTAVSNLSLGGLGRTQAWQDAIREGKTKGMIAVVAAGNDNINACVSSPAYVPEAITVGATDREDRKASYSNHGPCVDIFAPGSNTVSASHEDNTETRTLSGTSMAAPHVAGIVATMLEQDSSLTPDQVAARLVEDSTKGEVSFSLGDSGSPNRLAFSKTCGRE